MTDFLLHFDEAIEAAKASPRESALIAYRLLALPEMAGQELFRHPERMDRRQKAVSILHANTDALTAEELAQAIAHGIILVNANAIYSKAHDKMLREHPDLATPARRFACLVAAIEASATSAHPQMASTLVRWLGLRLVEEPFVEGAARLAELFRAGRIPADVVGATDDRALLEELAPQSVACAFALDPVKAFDRFGASLALSSPRPPQFHETLMVLGQDGFATHGLAGMRSTRPRGWVRADARWIEPLMTLREHDDPNISRPAGNALGNADLDLVLDRLPKPKKKIAALNLDLLGEVEVPLAERVWLGANRLVVAHSKSALTAYRLEPGLPVAATFELPEGVELSEERAKPEEDSWEVPGLYDVAIRADGGLAIGAAHLIALFDPSGKRIALKSLEDGKAQFPHALVFSADSLWVALVDADAHLAAAFSPDSLDAKAEVRIGKSFPSPAYFTSHTHPTEDVAIFEVECGQDGIWLPIAEPTGLRKHKLSGKQATIGFIGVAGSSAAFASGRQLTLRPWPLLDAPKKKRLDGSVVGAGIIDGAIALALAEVSNDPSAVELRRFTDGERIGKTRYPIGERFVALGAGVLVTRVTGDEKLRVRRLSL